MEDWLSVAHARCVPRSHFCERLPSSRARLTIIWTEVRQSTRQNLAFTECERGTQSACATSITSRLYSGGFGAGAFAQQIQERLGHAMEALLLAVNDSQRPE